MKTSKSKTTSQKLTGIVQAARLRVATAENRWKGAKEQALLAKRRRKEAKEAARRARKQAKLAKRAVSEAKQILAEAEKRLAQTAQPKAVVARKRKATKPATSPATKSLRPVQSQPDASVPGPDSTPTNPTAASDQASTPRDVALSQSNPNLTGAL